MATSANRVQIPAVSAVAVPDLGKTVIGLFESSKRHPPPQRPEMEVTQQLGEMAHHISQRLVNLGILANRPREEAPPLLLGALYRALGCRVSAWLQPPGRGLLQVQGCSLRSALALVGMDCRGVCTRIRQSALKGLTEPVSVGWSPAKEGCILIIQYGEKTGAVERAPAGLFREGSGLPL